MLVALYILRLTIKVQDLVTVLIFINFFQHLNIHVIVEVFDPIIPMLKINCSKVFNSYSP